MFLDAAQLVQLTGRKRPKAQCEFLAREGYHFRLNACGEPVVLVAEVHKRFGVDLAPQAGRAPGQKSIINWQALERRGMVRRRGQTTHIE
jgi:hypothetical protein